MIDHFFGFDIDRPLLFVIYIDTDRPNEARLLLALFQVESLDERQGVHLVHRQLLAENLSEEKTDIYL